MEEYKNCFEDYEISNFGNLRKKLKTGDYKNINGYILKTGGGYKYFQISRNKKRINHLFHHLVAKAFIGERPEGLVIDHIDRNCLNNNVDNLRYITQKENTHNNDNYKSHIEGEGKERMYKVQKEYRENNKEHIKKYLEENKEHIKQRTSIYNKNRYETIKDVKIEKAKEWYQNNKEHRKEYMKQWELKNNEIINCECGNEYKKKDKSHHLKTKKHLNNITDNNLL